MAAACAQQTEYRIRPEERRHDKRWEELYRARAAIDAAAEATYKSLTADDAFVSRDAGTAMVALGVPSYFVVCASCNPFRALHSCCCCCCSRGRNEIRRRLYYATRPRSSVSHCWAAFHNQPANRFSHRCHCSSSRRRPPFEPAGLPALPLGTGAQKNRNGRMDAIHALQMYAYYYYVGTVSVLTILRRSQVLRRFKLRRRCDHLDTHSARATPVQYANISLLGRRCDGEGGRGTVYRIIL